MLSKTKLRDCRIAIIGLGLMGGSLALALREHCQSIFGVDAHPSTLYYAIKQKIIDWGEPRLTNELQGQDLLILATPVKAILELIPVLPKWITEATLVMDIGSTKRQIMDAYHRLPGSYEAVGGHPMCGKASGGIASAEKTLYHNASFALIRSNNTTSKSVQLAENLVRAIGAEPQWLDAETHDEMTASISHLPYLISSALVQATPDTSSRLAGPGFHSTSRLAATPLSMMGDVLETNRDEILTSLDRFLADLQSYRQLLAEGNVTQLQRLLSKTREKYFSLLQSMNQAVSNED